MRPNRRGSQRLLPTRAIRREPPAARRSPGLRWLILICKNWMAGGEFAPALHAQQMLQLQPMLAQRRDQGVGGGHRVLNRQVDAHAADR